MEYSKTKGLLLFAYRLGIGYVFWYIVRISANKLNLRPIYKVSGTKLISLMKQFIVEKYGSFIEKIQDNYEKEKDMDDNAHTQIIWFFWAQGEDSMPELVKINIESIKRNAGGREIVVLDKKNINDYIELPNYIYEKLNNGQISPTHFSDILRFNLLYKYGGLWLDATIFISSKIPDICFQKRLFAFNYKHLSHYSQEKWEFFCLGAASHSLFMFYFSRLLNYYWLKEKYAFHYYMADIIMLVAYDKFCEVKSDIDNISINNSIFSLYEYIKLNEKSFSIDKALEICKKSFAHKFDRRFISNEHALILKQILNKLTDY